MYVNVEIDQKKIKITTIVEFYNSLQKEPNYSIKMIEYAKKNLTWDAQMSNIIKKMRDDFK